MSFEPKIKRGKAGRVECTVTFSEAETAPAEEKALHELSREIEIQGFRKGSAPVQMIREKVDPQKLFEQTVHNILPTTFERLIKEHDIKPVMHPRVEAVSREPLTLTIIFIEKPEVKLKGIDKIKLEKKKPSVEDKDVEEMITYVLDKHKTLKEVDREAKSGDQITMDFWGETAGKEIDGIRTTGHQVEIGSKTLIPGFEEALKGTKRNDQKSFTLTFPEKYHAEQLQGKEVTFHVTVTKVEDVSRPTLTDEFAKTVLQSSSAEEFRKQIRESMMQQEQGLEDQRRERQLMEEIRKCTQVELAEELIDEEAKQLFFELEQQLKRQSMTIDQWLKATGKKPEEVLKEMKEQGEKRLTLRLGMQTLVEQKNIDITDEEMEQVIEGFLAQATPEQRKEVEPAYQKGAQAYEQLKWQQKVEKALREMLS